MPLKYKTNNEVKDPRYNNVQLQTVKYNNNVVFERNALVTYRANGAVYATKSIDVGGECIGKVANPTRDRFYTFLGWSTSPTNATVKSSVVVTSSDPITLYAVWQHTHFGTSSEGGECYNDEPVMCTGQIYTPFGTHYVHDCRICKYSSARWYLADEDATPGANCNHHIGSSHLKDGITTYNLTCDRPTVPVIY